MLPINVLVVYMEASARTTEQQFILYDFFLSLFVLNRKKLKESLTRFWHLVIMKKYLKVLWTSETKIWDFLK